MYQNIRRFSYWPLMANDIIETALRCSACPKVHRTRASHQRKVKLLPDAGSLEFFTRNIVETFPKATHGHRFILVITYRFSKMRGSISLRSTTATDVAMACLVN